MTTPGRKPLPAATPVVVEVNHEALAQASQAADQMMALQAGYGEGRDLANQLLGQIQMSRAISKFTDVVSLSKLQYIKENKIYRSVAGQKAVDSKGNEIADVGTWAGFCAALGVSASKIDEDITNLKMFGEEALDQMQRTGIGYRELRQYRKLPEDQKLALIEVAKAGDKESFVELAEEIIAKHAKEKEATARAAEEAAEKLAAKDRVIVQKNELVDSLQEQVARKFSPSANSVAKTDKEQIHLDEISGSTLESLKAMRRLFLAADTAMNGTAPEAIELAARQAVEYLCQQLVDIATEFGIAVDFEQRLRPTWMDQSVIDAMVKETQRRAKGGVDADTEGDDDGDSDDTTTADNVHHLSGSAR